MAIDATNEKRFESDIEASFLSPAGGYVKGANVYDPVSGLYVRSLLDFVQRTQPKEFYGSMGMTPLPGLTALSSWETVSVHTTFRKRMAFSIPTLCELYPMPLPMNLSWTCRE